MELNEEWNNFMHKINEVSNLVRDMASGDKEKSDAAKMLADQYLQDKEVVLGDGGELVMKVKSDRTVINHAAFRSMDKKDTGELDKDVWMKEMSKDAEKRALDRKIRRERADTLKTQAVKAFRRGELDRALSCYSRAIEQVRDNHMLYCDRALINIKLGKYEKVLPDVRTAIQINENSFKARLYKAKAHLQLEEEEEYEQSRKELEEMFPQHLDLIQYFLTKTEEEDEHDEEESEEHNEAEKED